MGEKVIKTVTMITKILILIPQLKIYNIEKLKELRNSGSIKI